MNSVFPTRPSIRLAGHNGQVLAVTFSAGSGQYVGTRSSRTSDPVTSDAVQILTGSSDRSIRIFNPSSSGGGKTDVRPIQTYSAHGYGVLDIAVAESNDRFVSVGGDKTVFLWDVATARTLRRWTGHGGRVNACALAGEGDCVVVSGSYDGTVKLWDTKARSERPLMTLSEAKDSVSSIHVSGSSIVTGSIDGKVRCYDVRRGLLETDVIGAPVTSVKSSKANDSHLVSTLDSTIRLMDKRDGKLLQSFRDSEFVNDNYRIRSTLAAGDSLVISGGEDGRVFVWDVLTGGVRYRLNHLQSAITITDAGVGGRPAERTGKKEVVSAVAWNQLRKEFATAGGDGSVVVWSS